MSSFINLMASDVWSEADIKSRLHAEIRSEISEQLEQELNRALQGKVLGMHTMTDAEMALLMQFKAATDRAAVLGSQARADRVLLGEVLAHESAVTRLSQAAVELPIAAEPPTPVDGEPEVRYAPPAPDDTAYLADKAEREAAEAVVAVASPEVVALHLLRNPVKEEEEVIIPTPAEPEAVAESA